MLGNVVGIVQENWLLLLIGQYPNGPLGGVASTLILSALSIALAFPVGIMIALARISPWRVVFWPATPCPASSPCSSPS